MSNMIDGCHRLNRFKKTFISKPSGRTGLEIKINAPENSRLEKY